MSKKKKHIQTEKERLYQEKAAKKREEERLRVLREERKSATVFCCVALALLLALVGFFSWHTVRMRRYELNFERVQGTITGYEEHHSSGGSHHGSRTYYYYKISYTYEGKTYEFTDRTGHNYPVYKNIGKSTEIYVDPLHPARAEKVSSADFVSIICACFFAFLCVTYSVGLNIYLSAKGSTFRKRFLCVWSVDILLGVILLLLFWAGLPGSGFGAVFTRIDGAIGVCVVMGLAVLALMVDAIVTGVLRSKMKNGYIRR